MALLLSYLESSGVGDSERLGCPGTEHQAGHHAEDAQTEEASAPRE